MKTIPAQNTKVKVKLETPIAGALFGMDSEFHNKNEWEVIGIGRTMTNGESMVNIKNLHGVMGNQVMQFTKEELEEI